MSKISLRTIFLCVMISILLLVIDFLMIKTDNSTSLSDSITVKYPNSVIAELKADIEQCEISFYKLKQKYKLQCIRKTEREVYKYYVVLQQEDGKYAFIFLNKDLKAQRMLICDRIRFKNEFDFIAIDQTTKGVLEAFDENRFAGLGASALDGYVYVLQEGLLSVAFHSSAEMDPEWYEKPNFSTDNNTVRYVRWFPNEQLQNPDTLPYYPNILQKDKTELSQGDKKTVP